MRVVRLLSLLVSFVAVSGCASAYKQSLGGDTAQVFNRIFITDFNTAWLSVLDALKSSRLDVTNREGGFLKTRWTENTAEKNFVDSYGEASAFLKAQYRFQVTVTRNTFFNGRPAVKVVVQKEQLVQRDVLEGWRPIETDTVDENTLLYRIGRLITMRTRLARIEEERNKKAMEKPIFD